MSWEIVRLEILFDCKMQKRKGKDCSDTYYISGDKK